MGVLHPGQGRDVGGLGSVLFRQVRERVCSMDRDTFRLSDGVFRDHRCIGGVQEEVVSEEGLYGGAYEFCMSLLLLEHAGRRCWVGYCIAVPH